MKKKTLLFVITILCFHYTSYGNKNFKLQNGDLIFQNIHCGPLCDAINEVTIGCRGRSFSHVGIAQIKNDSIYIIEAISHGVSVTPLYKFLARSHEIAVGRLRQEKPAFIRKVIKEALRYVGKPYDDYFDISNDAYYCSELVYFAFKHANHNIPIFRLAPMTYISPKTKHFFPAWINYFRALNVPIPEGKPGINPGGISRSKKLKMYLDINL